MASIGYVSRSWGRHDRRWVATLREADHVVSVFVGSGALDGDELPAGTQVWNTPQDLRAYALAASVELFVAGPVTDATVAAVDADVVPTLGLSWGFDLMLELGAPEVAEAVSRTLPKARGVHVDCRYLRDRVVQLGVPGDRVSVAPWGIDTGFFTPASLASSTTRGADPDTRIIYSSRSWEPLYDVPTVVSGFALAHERDSSLRLVLGGTGSRAGEITGLVERLGLREVVTMVGSVDPVAVRKILQQSAVYVSAARSDGTSLSLLEALAVGVPTVVTDLPGNREWVESAEYGALFPVGDPSGLAAALHDQLALANNPERVATRRRQALERGDWTRNRQIFLDAVHKVLGSER